jgi:hypothetical protein
MGTMIMRMMKTAARMTVKRVVIATLLEDAMVARDIPI